MFENQPNNIDNQQIFIHYKTSKDKAEAFRKMINMRSSWEQHINDYAAKHNLLPF